MTRLYSRAESTDPCRQTLVADTSRVSPDSVAIMLLRLSMVFIHLG